MLAHGIDFYEFFSPFSPQVVPVSIDKICQGLKPVFDHTSKHLEVRQKYSAARRIFDSLLGVWTEVVKYNVRPFVFHVKLLLLAAFGNMYTRSPPPWQLTAAAEQDRLGVNRKKCDREGLGARGASWFQTFIHLHSLPRSLYPFLSGGDFAQGKRSAVDLWLNGLNSWTNWFSVISSALVSYLKMSTGWSQTERGPWDT